MSTNTSSISSTTTLPIACLESYINPSHPIESSLVTNSSSPALHLLPSITVAKLRNVGPARVKDMRALGQSKQILSHIPIAATLATCTKCNDALFAAIQMNSERFAALAILPADDKDASKELQRCVTKMKFVGGVVGLRTDSQGGIVLSTAYEELWDTADRYHVPIMLRTMWPVGSEVGLLNYAILREFGKRGMLTDGHSSQPISPISLMPSSLP
jgi:predicted TIM-barrel fold metal-dependent hydrolase